MSRLKSRERQTATALEFSEHARTLLDQLAARHPKDLGYQVDLSRCHSFIGRLLQTSGKSAEALRSFQRAVDILESLPKLDPANSYQLAVNLALSVSLIGASGDSAVLDDEASLSPANRLRRQVYGKRAVAAVNRAISGGFGNPELYKSDADLDSLRDRPDFQKSLGELAKRERTEH